jgi:hypothetical protein
MATADDVAEWMKAEVDEHDSLYLSQAVLEIRENFGDEFLHENANGNLAIKQYVLDSFLKKTKDDVVWAQRDKMWRKRQANDEPGRRQA